MFGGLLQDLREGLRAIRRQKIVTVFAVASLATAIGADAALFTILDELALRGVPARDPGRLVRVYMSESDGRPFGAISHPDYRDLASETKTLEALAVESFRPLNVVSTDRGERVLGAMVSGSYFGTLGVAAQAGRLIVPADDRLDGTNAVAVLSDDYWRRRFGADPAVVGRKLVVNGHTVVVAGVAPPGLRGLFAPLRADVWLPSTMETVFDPAGHDLRNRGGRKYLGLGRLRPGVRAEQADAELDGLVARLGRIYPESDSGRTADVIPEAAGRIFPQARGAVLAFFGLLFAVVTLVLLIACANVAALLLARGEVRRRELGLRAALGADRRRLAQMLVVEGVWIGVLAGLAGFGFAHVVTRALASFRPPVPIPLTLSFEPDARVLALSILLGLLASMLFAVAPAMRVASGDLLSSLRDGGLASTARSRARRVLVVAQLVVTFVLLAGAGLFLRALDRARAMDPGFDTARLSVASLDLPLSGYTLERGRVLVDRLLEELRARPGVEAASVADHLTLGLGFTRTSYLVEGRPAPPTGQGEVGRQLVGPDWFRALGLPIVRGRAFTGDDRANAPGVVIVNETFAKRWWPGESAVGKRVNWSPDGSGPWMTVVGVARDTKYFSLGEAPQPFVYAPYVQGFDTEATIVVRSKRPPEGMAAEIAATARRLDPNLLVFDAMSIERHLGVALLPVRLASAMLTGMGAVALLIAGVGLFGLMAYDASQRRREIGLRIALGSTRRAVVGLVLRDGFRMVVTGVVLGAGAAAALAQLVRGQLYGVPPLDPLTYGAISLVLLVTGLAACGLPAREASRVDPMLVLRHD